MLQVYPNFWFVNRVIFKTVIISSIAEEVMERPGGMVVVEYRNVCQLNIWLWNWIKTKEKKTSLFFERRFFKLRNKPYLKSILKPQPYALQTSAHIA